MFSLLTSATLRVLDVENSQNQYYIELTEGHGAGKRRENALNEALVAPIVPLPKA